MYYLYVIGEVEDLCEPYYNCYVGVTKNPSQRWKEHQNNYTVGKFIRHFGLVYPENMIIIDHGDQKTMYENENKLRPTPFIGLNEAAGGNGGDTGVYAFKTGWKHTEESKKKISAAHKGKKKSEEHVKRISESKILNGSHVGNKNPKSKQWLLSNPDKTQQFVVEGNLFGMCKILNLNFNTLRKHRNSEVPPLNLNGYGGFRPKNEQHLQQRLNTTGWSLHEVKGTQ